MGVCRLWILMSYTVFGSVTCCSVFAQQPQAGDKSSPRAHSEVKLWTEWTEFKSQGDCVIAIVTKISNEKLEVVVPTRLGQIDPETREFVPIDLLAKDKCLKNCPPAYAYLWSEVKCGDTVGLLTACDSESKIDYCIAIGIARRPKAKLPVSQLASKDKSFMSRSICNDIDNGEDVGDAVIAKAFPAWTTPVDLRNPSGPVRVIAPGGLTPEYQLKLDAIRAKKKEAELKAPPPVKK